MKKYEVTLEIGVSDLKELLVTIENLSKNAEVLALDRVHYLDRYPIMDNPLSEDAEGVEEGYHEEIQSNSP